jgi:hypothetical protein
MQVPAATEILILRESPRVTASHRESPRVTASHRKSPPPPSSSALRPRHTRAHTPILTRH